MFDWKQIIDKYYPAGTSLRDIFMRHSRSVASLAAELNAGRREPLDPDTVEAAAMLHDIGIFLTDAPSIDCHGHRPYICHGVLGADLLRKEGAPEILARVCERHTGAGLTEADIRNGNLPLDTTRCYMPESELEKLVCYADKFYSKSGDMHRKAPGKVYESMERFGSASLSRFKELERWIADRSANPRA